MKQKNSKGRISVLRFSFMLSLLCFLTISLGAQIGNTPQEAFRSKAKIEKSKTGLNSVKATTWQQQRESHSESGLIDLEVVSHDAGVSQIRYQYTDISSTNPFQIDHAYHFNEMGDGTMSVDLDAFMDPIDLYVDESINMSFNGDKVVIPAQVGKGSFINEVHGEYALTLENNATFSKRYKVALTNFQVKNVTTKNIKGTSYEAIELSFDFYNDITVNNKPVVTKRHQVTGYLIPGLGFVQSNRIGENDMMVKKVALVSKSLVNTIKTAIR